MLSIFCLYGPLSRNTSGIFQGGLLHITGYGINFSNARHRFERIAGGKDAVIRHGENCMQVYCNELDNLFLLGEELEDVQFLLCLQLLRAFFNFYFPQNSPVGVTNISSAAAPYTVGTRNNVK